VQIHDNRAVGVLCYLPTYTFVEKRQTVSTKYRLLKAGEAFPANLMRHYYDIYCVLSLLEVQQFIGTPAFEARKLQRFRTGDELVAPRGCGNEIAAPQRAGAKSVRGRLRTKATPSALLRATMVPPILAM
jgi:hypothetical protein